MLREKLILVYFLYIMFNFFFLQFISTFFPDVKKKMITYIPLGFRYPLTFDLSYIFSYFNYGQDYSPILRWQGDPPRWTFNLILEFIIFQAVTMMLQTKIVRISTTVTSAFNKLRRDRNGAHKHLHFIGNKTYIQSFFFFLYILTLKNLLLLLNHI